METFLPPSKHKLHSFHTQGHLLGFFHDRFLESFSLLLGTMGKDNSGCWKSHVSNLHLYFDLFSHWHENAFLDHGYYHHLHLVDSNAPQSMQYEHRCRSTTSLLQGHPEEKKLGHHHYWPCFPQ